MQVFNVRVTKDYLVFCAAHFITYEGHSCESLHGHNYRIAVSMTGQLNGNWYVFDFVTLKQIMKKIIEPLDHRVLLPLNNPLIRIQHNDGGIISQYKERIYQFPEADVVLLPVPNTTVEMLAAHLIEQLKTSVGNQAMAGVQMVELEVEESPGQSATCREIYDHHFSGHTAYA